MSVFGIKVQIVIEATAARLFESVKMEGGIVTKMCSYASIGMVVECGGGMCLRIAGGKGCDCAVVLNGWQEIPANRHPKCSGPGEGGGARR